MTDLRYVGKNQRIDVVYDNDNFSLSVLDIPNPFYGLVNKYPGTASILSAVSHEKACVVPIGVVLGFSRTPENPTYSINLDFFDVPAVVGSLKELLETAQDPGTFEKLLEMMHSDRMKKYRPDEIGDREIDSRYLERFSCSGVPAGYCDGTLSNQ